MARHITSRNGARITSNVAFDNAALVAYKDSANFLNEVESILNMYRQETLKDKRQFQIGGCRSLASPSGLSILMVSPAWLIIKNLFFFA
jgi:hypothetical protein